MENAQKLYEEYREKFAKQYSHTIEYATKCQSVRLYKQYLEEKYGVKINEEV